MNKKIYKIFPVIALALLTMFTSCLGDSDYENNLIGTKNNGNQNFVEVHLTSADNSNTVSRSYDAIGRDTTINMIPINLTSGPAQSDVTVTFQVLDASNSTVVKSYVDDDGFVVPDATKYTILNAGNKVTIPAGSSTGYLQIKLNPNNLIGDTYILAIKITAVSDVKYTISNLNVGYVKMGAKNMYDGKYEVSGTMVDATNAAFTGAYPLPVYLITQDGSSVGYWDVDVWDNYFHAFMNGSSYSGYGSFAPVFKFDASNNVIAVTNIYGQPAGNGRSAQLDPSGINKFDPATKTLKVKYWMNQPGSTHRTSFNETFTYVEAR